ncbi:hypothetical protein HDU85_004693, partial [Gaertneriomyces sp. JEL0708]
MRSSLLTYRVLNTLFCFFGGLYITLLARLPDNVSPGALYTAPIGMLIIGLGINLYDVISAKCLSQRNRAYRLRLFNMHVVVL